MKIFSTICIRDSSCSLAPNVMVSVFRVLRECVDILHRFLTGVPAVPGPSPSSFTSERHKISFIMNDIDISPLSPTATVRTGFTPDVTVPTAPASIFQPSSAASLSSLAATSSSALASSSEAAPSRRGIKSSFVSRYPGTSRFDPYERPEVDPPPKKPRKVEQRKQRKPKSQ